MRAKPFLIIIGVVVFALGVTSADAQLTLQLGAGGGVLSSQSDLSGNTIGYYTGENYGLGSGIDLIARARVGLLGLRLVGEINYASLSNDGESEPGKGKIEVSQKILTLRAGPEFAFSIPLSPITPYVGGTIALHRFSGETVFTGVAKVPSGTYSVESASRFGIGVHGGVQLGLSPHLTLDVGVGYDLMNIGGKSWDDVDPSKDQRIDSYLSLNDAKDPKFQTGSDEHFIKDDRTINSMRVVAVLMFGL